MATRNACRKARTNCTTSTKCGFITLTIKCHNLAIRVSAAVRSRSDADDGCEPSQRDDDGFEEPETALTTNKTGQQPLRLAGARAMTPRTTWKAVGAAGDPRLEAFRKRSRRGCVTEWRCADASEQRGCVHWWRCADASEQEGLCHRVAVSRMRASRGAVFTERRCADARGCVTEWRCADASEQRGCVH